MKIGRIDFARLSRKLGANAGMALGVALLAACGGSDSGGGPPSTINTAPSARIASLSSVPVGTVVTFDGTTSSDPEGDAITYAWTLTSSPSSSSATVANATTARPVLTPAVAGSYTLSLVVSDGKLQSAGATVTFTATSATPPAIVLSKNEPVSGTVQLSLSGTVSGSVTWYVDLSLLGTGASATGNAISWNTASVSNAPHLIVARIQTGSDAYQEVRRSVDVSNSSVTISAVVTGTTGTINIDVRAGSTYGISSVLGTLDSGATTTLTSPNACSRFCGGSNDVYRFTVDAARAGSGAHTMLIVGTDAVGSSQTLTVSVPVSNAPALALTGPADGAFVHGTLNLAGTATSDKTGTITVTAKLGDVLFLSTTQSAFTGSFDLAGVVAGAYSLSVSATDSANQATRLTRTVIVTSSSALAYAPVFVLPTAAQLVAAEGHKVLYTTAEGASVRDLLSGTEVTLANAGSIAYASDWQLVDGRAYAFGKGADCVLYCIYQWAADGTMVNLTNPNPYSRASNIGGGWAYDLHPVARSGYVVWVNDKAADTAIQTNATGRYTVYNVNTGAYTKVGVPAGVNYVGNWNYDFAVVSGVAHFYFWGQTGGDGTASTFDLYKWQSDTGTSTRLTSGGARNIYPQTDGARVAWEQSPVGGNADGTLALLTLPLSGGTATTQAAKANSNFSLRDGVLAWTESTATSKAVKAATSLQAATLSSLSTAVLYANGGTTVVYGEQGKAYSWNSVLGTTTLRIETAPSQVFIAGGAMVFTVNSALYRILLN